MNPVVAAIIGFIVGSFGSVIHYYVNKKFTSRQIEVEVVDQLPEEKLRLKAIILGAGRLGDIVYHQLVNCKSHVVQVVGFVDDAPEKKGKYLNGSSILGGTENLESIIKTKHINIVALAILKNQKPEELFQKQMDEVKNICLKYNVTFIDQLPEKYRSIEVYLGQAVPRLAEVES